MFKTDLGIKDAYKSIAEALTHGGMANRVKVRIDWVDAELFDREDAAPYLDGFHAILVPGGFGERGTEGYIGFQNHDDGSPVAFRKVRVREL